MSGGDVIPDRRRRARTVFYRPGNTGIRTRHICIRSAFYGCLGTVKTWQLGAGVWRSGVAGSDAMQEIERRRGWALAVSSAVAEALRWGWGDVVMQIYSCCGLL